MCPEASLLSAYFDNELNGSQKELIENHLLNCPACRATLDLFQSQREIMRRDIPVVQDNPERL
ncbi:MAG: zf-HC2 domain-containing protein, partial [Spirochaetaceae bacterium]|nr:zf-HC2 domain-containing protein [Spirochaetaceae bacterium]